MDNHSLQILQATIGVLQHTALSVEHKAKIATAILKQLGREAQYCSFIPELKALIAKAIQDEV